jgi:hypothetical protein
MIGNVLITGMVRLYRTASPGTVFFIPEQDAQTAAAGNMKTAAPIP